MTEQERIEIFRENGKLFGYPQCCIDQLCNDLLTGKFTHKSTEREFIANLHFGFIPCQKHAEQLLILFP